MSTLSPHLTASGNIYPSRFVKISGSRTAALAGAGDACSGISQVGTNKAPIPGVTSQYAAESGETLQIHGLGAFCLLELGTGGATYGNLLKSDANGKGVAASSGDECGAKAMESGSAGEIILVQVIDRKG